MTMTVVRMEADGSCATAPPLASLRDLPPVVVSIDACDECPETMLSMRARPYELAASCPLLRLPLPGELGARLLSPPVEFGWNHAATLKVSDLDRLLQQYHRVTSSDALMKKTWSHTCLTSHARELDDASSEHESEPRSEEEVESEADALSADEEDDDDDDLVEESDDDLGGAGEEGVEEDFDDQR